MTDQTPSDRATMPAAHNPVLERRTVDTANRNLLKYLRPGISVLDVGCGSGAITRSIAEKMGAGGRVLGVDPNTKLIELARQNAKDVPGKDVTGLYFQPGDVYTFDTDERFDLVTCARTLQWLTDPRAALTNMKRLLKPGGFLAVLDFNHEKIHWEPEPPRTMHQFYTAFLKWRQDAGFDNAIADHLAELMDTVGLIDIRVEDQSEIAKNVLPTFAVDSRLWAEVAELRGPQLVESGYITDEQRLQAIVDYDTWIATVGESMTVYMLAVEGRKPEE